jgi:DNA-binding response OmpR family regulator
MARSLYDWSPTAARPAVALVCGEPRLRRILHLALERDGYAVLDYADGPWAGPGLAPVAAVVDLDSLPLCPAAVDQLGAHGALAGLPVLFISVYPAEPERLALDAPSDYLQPPFPADEVVVRLAALLSKPGQPPCATPSCGSPA